MQISPLLSLVIVLLALYGLCVTKNMVKSIILLSVMEAAIILFFLNLVYSDGMRIPIRPEAAAEMVDPLPQALMITAIVIGAGVTAFGLLMTLKVYRDVKTWNWQDVLKRGE